MTGFSYFEGSLNAERVPLRQLAAEVGTPFYCYALGAIEDTYRRLAGAFAGLDPLICYALKANANLAVIHTLAELGAGADVVSEGELRQALAAGVPAERIVFAGVGKTEAEMAFGLEVGIAQFNVESIPELEALNAVARQRGVTAPVALRINPDVDARTHEKIATGKAGNKFGIDLPQARDAVERALQLPAIRIEGLAVHIGSQLTSIAPFRSAFTCLAKLYDELRQAGVPLRRLDLGGGLGIVYKDEHPPELAHYAALVKEVTDGLGAEVVIEPGRFLVGNAGLLITRVLYVKQGQERRFLIVDAAMNDLIRPPLYGAWHEIVPVAEPAPDARLEPVDIAGPVCESGDTLAHQRPMPPVEAGDLLAICSTGAYGAVMASSYNLRRVAPEVVVRGQQHAVVRPRLSYAELIGKDVLPEWLLTPEVDATRGAA